MIYVEDVSVSIHEKNILENVNIRVNKGDYFGLIGPNGSGKTTLLKTIATLIEHCMGTIHLNNRSNQMFKQKELARQISYVPQDTSIDFDFNVKDIVAMGRHAYSKPFQNKQHDNFMIQDAMERTNTWRFRDESILNLSGGQQQLVFIAKAVAQDTPIILLDEPISALDIYYQMHILKLLENLTQQGKTVITVLHDLNLAARFCKRMALLEHGKVKAFGTSEEVLTSAHLKEAYYIDTNIREDHLIQALHITPL